MQPQPQQQQQQQVPQMSQIPPMSLMSQPTYQQPMMANQNFEAFPTASGYSRPSIVTPIVQSKTTPFFIPTKTYLTWSLVNVVVSLFMGLLG
jgi:hypothetical protein